MPRRHAGLSLGVRIRVSEAEWQYDNKQDLLPCFKAPFVTESPAGGREDECSQSERSLTPSFPSPSPLVDFDSSERYEVAPFEGFRGGKCHFHLWLFYNLFRCQNVAKLPVIRCCCASVWEYLGWDESSKVNGSVDFFIFCSLVSTFIKDFYSKWPKKMYFFIFSPPTTLRSNTGYLLLSYLSFHHVSMLTGATVTWT